MLAGFGCAGTILTVLFLVLAFARHTGIWDLSEHRAIRYRSTQPSDPIARLQRRIDAGEIALSREPGHGYLSALLRNLEIPVLSQGLVFSKTSFHRDLISPKTPRALYFNDHTYVGWVPHAENLEIATLDPQLGTVFYTLDQRQEPPRFVRRTHECLQCHSAGRTQRVPGLVLRSVFTNEQGRPARFGQNIVLTDATPFADRWGGWYVSGTHGAMLHRGNQARTGTGNSKQPDLKKGANVTDLGQLFDPTSYLAPHSDIVALMLLQHQAHLHNVMTRANFDTRVALAETPGSAVNRTLEADESDFEELSEEARMRVGKATEALVRALLFAGEAPLRSQVRGTTSFARDFAARGPHDRKGRSLRELDLRRRLLRYPCSYLIHSEQFDGLPRPTREYVYRRLWQVLDGKDNEVGFRHLTDEDRAALIEILTDTRPGFAAAQPADFP